MSLSGSYSLSVGRSGVHTSKDHLAEPFEIEAPLNRKLSQVRLFERRPYARKIDRRTLRNEDTGAKDSILLNQIRNAVEDVCRQENRRTSAGGVFEGFLHRCSHHGIEPFEG